MHRRSATRPEVKAAVDHVKQHGIKLEVRVDVGKANDRYCINVVSGGFGAESRVSQVIREIDDIGNAANHYTRYRQLPQFTVESDEPIQYNVDGEPVYTSSMSFSVLPRCLNVVTGSGS